MDRLRRVPAHEGDDLASEGGAGGRLLDIGDGGLALRLPDGQENEGGKDGGRSDPDQDPLPAEDPEARTGWRAPSATVIAISWPPTSGPSVSPADEAELQQREGAGDDFGREGVGDQRIGGGGMGRAARGEEDAAADELHEILREAAERGDQPDQGDAARQHIFSRPDVGEAGKRDADEEIADDRGRAAEEAELPVGQPEILLDLLGEHAEHGLIEEGDEGREDDREQSPVARGRRRPFLRRIGAARPGRGGGRYRRRAAHAPAP